MNYKELYRTYWGYGYDEWIPCRLCRSTAADVHHIEQKGMGGRDGADVIENLIALCRKEHDEVQGIKKWIIILKDIVVWDIEEKKRNPAYQPGDMIY